ncbi:MAG: STAS domain-containing protein [Pseudomonadota bacterium]
MIERDGNQLRVRGALTIASVTAVCEAGKRQFGGGDLVVDLAAVTEVDSTALSLLFEWRRTAREKNLQIAFRNLPASLQSLAALYGLTELVAEIT